MNATHSGADSPGAQAAPPRRRRARPIALIVVILILLGVGAAAYYYLFYLPETPQAKLAEYFALEEKGDYDGTYRFLSAESRKIYPLEQWKSDHQLRAMLTAGVTVEYVIGQARCTADRCEISVATKATMKSGQTPGAEEFSTTATVPYFLLKEKTGWKLDIIEQSKELQRREAGQPEQPAPEPQGAKPGAER